VKDSEIWVCDCTNIVNWKHSGKQLFVLLDIATKQVIAFCFCQHPNLSVQIASCLRNALKNAPVKPLFIHSDNGKLDFHCDNFNDVLDEFGVIHSYSDLHVSKHNSFTESWNSILNMRCDLKSTFGLNYPIKLLEDQISEWITTNYSIEGLMALAW
jgi:hypothetical protein